MPQIPGLGLIQDLLNALTSDASAITKAFGIEIILKKMRQGHFDSVIRETPEYGQLLRDIGFSAFRCRWAYVRQLMPLQSRLFIEQLLWTMGPPWRSLLTGFNPVALGKLGVLVPFASETPEDTSNVPEGEDVFVPGPSDPAYPWYPPGAGPEDPQQVEVPKWKRKRYY